MLSEIINHFFAFTNIQYMSVLSVQHATLVLNAARRFRYTLDLNKEEEKEEIRQKIRMHAQVIRVIFP